MKAAAPRPARRRPSLAPWTAPLVTLAVGALLSAVAFGAGGGQSLPSATHVEMLLMLGGGLAVAAALLVAPRGSKLYGGWSVALLALLAALSAVSVAWAVQPSDAWVEANQLFAYLAAFAGAVALARVAPGRWPSVVGGVVLAATVVSGYAILTKLFPEVFNEFELFSRLRQPFGYWNAVGLMGALAVPGCLWLGSRREGPPLVNALAFPALGICLSATLMAYSRGSLLAAAIGAAVWFVLVPLRLRGAGVLIAGIAGGALVAAWTFGQEGLSTDRAPLDVRATAGHELVILVGAVVVLLYVAGLAATFAADVGQWRPRTRRRAGIALLVALALTPFAAAGALATTDQGLKGSLDQAWSSLTDTSEVGPANDPSRLTATGSVRSRYWAEAFKMFADEPVAGVGANGYATVRPRYRQDLLDVRHAHGYVPETMAELGIVGLLVSLALLAVWLLATRRSIRGARDPAGKGRSPEFAGLVTLAATAVVFGAHSTIDWTWAVPGTAVVGLVCAGWVAGRGPDRLRLRRVEASRREWRSVARAVPAAAVLLFAILAAWTAWQPLQSVDAVDAAQIQLEEGRVDRALAEVRDARDRNPLSVEPLFELAAVEQRRGNLDAADRALVDATKLQPGNWATWMRLADFRVFDANRPRDAWDPIRRAIYLNPRSWDVTQRYLDIRRKMKASP